MNLQKLLLKYVLEQNELTISDENLEIVSSFLVSHSQIILFSKNNTVYVDEKKTIILGQNQPSVRIGIEYSPHFFEKTQLVGSLPLLHHSDSVEQLAFLNEIPMQRLVNNYDELEELPIKYKKKITDIYWNLKPLLDYLLQHSIVTRTTKLKTKTLSDTIREFIQNELK